MSAVKRKKVAPNTGSDQAAYDLEMKYYTLQSVAHEFSSAKERKAIAAICRCLSMHAICAWELKNGTYSTVAWSKTVRRDFGTSTACVISQKWMDEVRTLFGELPKTRKIRTKGKR